MLMKMTEFFKNLPAKKCTKCGKEIEEQHECYVNECTKCSKIAQIQLDNDLIQKIENVLSTEN